MEHKGSAGIQDSVSCGLLACSVAATKAWPIIRNCGVAGLTCMLILRREELLILSSNTPPQIDGRNFYQFDFYSHHHYYYFFFYLSSWNWLRSLNCASKAKCRANYRPRKEPLKG
jgi:hypothetical protein